MKSTADQTRQSRSTAIVVWSLLLSMAALVWVFGSPLGGSPDEPSHIAYAWGVTTGQGFGGPDLACESSPCPRTAYDVPPGLVPEPACYAFKAHIPAECSGPSRANPYPSYMTRYPPPYYYVVGSALWAGVELGVNPEDVGYFGRIAGAAAALSLLIPASVMAANRDPRVIPYLVASLSAMSLFMIATINPSGLEISAAIALATACGLLIRGGSTGARVLLLYSSAWLAWSRPVGWLWAAMVLVFGFALVAESQRDWRGSFTSFGWALPASLVAVATSVIWFVYALGARSVSSVGSSMPDSSSEQFLAVILRWGGILRENIGVLGWLDTPLPDLAILAAAGLLTLLAAGGFRAAVNRRAAWIVAAYFGSLLVGISLLMAYQQFLWQGRYVLPSLAAGLVFIGFVSAPSNRWRRWGAIIASGLWFIAIGASLWLYARYAFGLQRGTRYIVPDLSGDAVWAGAVGAWPLFVIAVVTACALPAVLWALSAGPVAVASKDPVQHKSGETT